MIRTRYACACSISGRFEAQLADLQARDFRIQRLTGNPQLRCRTGWSCDASFTLCQCGFDHLSFAVGHRCDKWGNRASVPSLAT